MIDKRSFYINGAWVSPATARDFDVVNPSNEEPCAIISLGDESDTNAAVVAAKSALPGWSGTDVRDRIALVERIQSEYEKRSDEMAKAISLEMGAPIDMATAQQVGAGRHHIGDFLRAAKDFKFERSLGNDKIIYEAAGVCALITPWNWPMNQVTLKVIPALLAGCTTVLKPSEIAPLSSLLFAEFVHDSGAPAGVFNLVNGDGSGVGTQLCRHPDVDLISFTGSTRAGRLIMANAAETLKRVYTEMGGKGANLVFADADEKAVERGVVHCFNNSGQSCNAPTRMLVERSMYDNAVATAQSVAEDVTIGLAKDSGGHIGPVVSDVQYDKIQKLIQKGIDEGARLVTGGPGLPGNMASGYFVKPTVFADVSNSMTIAREEIFGPVLSIIPFDSEEEAIAIANDTPYGLTNYIQTSDTNRRERLCRKLRSGMVEINGQGGGSGRPFGGMKGSGNAREGGMWGLEEYLEVKAVSGLST